MVEESPKLHYELCDNNRRCIACNRNTHRFCFNEFSDIDINEVEPVYCNKTAESDKISKTKMGDGSEYWWENCTRRKVEKQLDLEGVGAEPSIVLYQILFGRNSSQRSFVKRLDQTSRNTTYSPVEGVQNSVCWQKNTFRARWQQLHPNIDNRWTVSYNPSLNKKFSCRINVERCVSRLGSINYLFKHVWKGRDKITIQLQKSCKTQRDKQFCGRQIHQRFKGNM